MRCHSGCVLKHDPGRRWIFRSWRAVLGTFGALALAGSALFATGPALAQRQAPALGPAVAYRAAPSISDVKAKVEKLNNEAEAATEAYNGAKEKRLSLQKRLSAAQTRLKLEKTAVAEARTNVGRLAAQMYRTGDLADLTVFLGSREEALRVQSGLASTITDRQAAALETLREAERKLTQQEKDLKAQAQKLAATEKTLRQSERTVKKKLSEAKAELSRLSEAEQRKILQGAGNVANSCQAVAAEPPNAKAAKALKFACAQLGDPYLWGGNGPNSFDCSGLTKAAWSAAGVSIMRTAADQANSSGGKHISSSNLLPGDLVFFNSPITHVGIYLGDGLMVHAPHTGDVVRVAGVTYGTLTDAVRF
jgi:peptidoglycan DL-endopeptidase CwlO